MRLTDQPLRSTHHVSELGEWELAYRTPVSPLQPFVYPYCGYRESSLAITDRREVAGIIVPIIINLGPALDVSVPGQPETFERFDGPFVAGLHGGHTVVRTIGEQTGVQVNVSPIGARVLFGMPMSELANRVVTLEDVLGADAAILVERLRAVPDWSTRFDFLDAALLRRFAASSGPSVVMAWTWTRIVAEGGNVDVAALAGRCGWSNKRLIAEFRDQLGLPPKLVGRIVRFNGARRAAEQYGTARSLASIAEQCGYYDQAHFNHDFREFAGIPPLEYLRTQLPDVGGFSAASTV